MSNQDRIESGGIAKNEVIRADTINPALDDIISARLNRLKKNSSGKPAAIKASKEEIEKIANRPQRVYRQWSMFGFFSNAFAIILVNFFFWLMLDFAKILEFYKEICAGSCVVTVVIYAIISHVRRTKHRDYVPKSERKRKRMSTDLGQNDRTIPVDEEIDEHEWVRKFRQ